MTSSTSNSKSNKSKKGNRKSDSHISYESKDTIKKPMPLVDENRKNVWAQIANEVDKSVENDKPRPLLVSMNSIDDSIEFIEPTIKGTN